MDGLVSRPKAICYPVIVGSVCGIVDGEFHVLGVGVFTDDYLGFCSVGDGCRDGANGYLGRTLRDLIVAPLYVPERIRCR